MEKGKHRALASKCLIDHFLDNIMSKYFVNWLVSCEAEPERKRESCGDWERSQSQSGERKWRVEWPRVEVAEGGEWSKETLSINHFHFTLTDNIMTEKIPEKTVIISSESVSQMNGGVFTVQY